MTILSGNTTNKARKTVNPNNVKQPHLQQLQTLAHSVFALLFRLFDELVWEMAFGAMSSWSGFKVARARAALAESPRHGHTSCPACREAPPAGDYWPCPRCARGFDPFR